MTFQSCDALLIARSDWNARLKCHNAALYSLMRTFVWSELQITAEAWEKASARVADAASAAAAARSREQLTRCEFAAQSDVLCVGVFEQKRVGGRIDNKPLHYWWSLIDVIASFALQPAHVLLMTGEPKWLLPLAPRSSQRPDGHKALIYYDFIITPGFNITWATKHIALFGKSNRKHLNNSTSARVEFSVGFRGKPPARPPSIIDNAIENKPRFSSEDLEALLIHSCPVFSQHPAKKQV